MTDDLIRARPEFKPPAECRAIGLQLLNESVGYEIAVALESPIDIAVRGITVRTRRLVRGAYHLADEGLGIEAMVLVRSAVEYGLTIAWILKKPDQHVIRFALNGIDDRFTFDDLAFEVKGERALDDEVREDMESTRAELAAQVKSLRMPDFKQRAKEADLPEIYGLYVADSAAAAHPTMWSLDMILEEHGPTNATVVHADVSPERQMPDPYYRGAYALGLVLFHAAQHEGRDATAARINALT
jgi:hypothetical protein